MAEIRVGTSSWADRLLLQSGWYPPGITKPAQRLTYYARHFDLVEVDTSYYAIPSPQTTAGWVRHTPDDFVFNVKAFSLFTGHPTRSTALPADLRTGPRGKVLDELWDRFHDALAPMASSGKLGAILLQFPPWVQDSPRSRQRIIDTIERCRPHRVAVELRHSSWFGSGDVLDLLKDQGAAYCCVDMPQGYPDSVPPVLEATSGELGMVRLHGHSPQWSSGDKQERFRYAYPQAELEMWGRRVQALGQKTERLHVLFNNCCAGQAQKDASRFKTLLGTS